MKKIIKKILIKFLGFELMQYKFGRKFIKGTFYCIESDITCGEFWSKQEIKSCGSRIIKKETY